MARTLRVVCYGINGGGVGHVTRLTAISRWMKRYAVQSGVKPEIFFLSSSEADSLLYSEGFPSFKVPSKTIASQAGLDKATYLGLAKQWIWHSIGLLRPDLFVVDTFPRGSFGELPACLDLCKKRGFVYRPVKADFGADPEFQSALNLYDAIVAPVDDASGLVVPAAVRPRVHAAGIVAIRERVELLSRAAARAELGIEDADFAVFASAGGGGDEAAHRDLGVVERAVKQLRESAPGRRVVLVLGAGPLSTKSHAFRADVRIIRSPGFSRWLLGADVAIAAAGYNSFAELMMARIPAILVPQEKVADDQLGRARGAEAVGAAVIVPRPLTESAVATALEPLLEAPVRERMTQGWASLPPPRGARVAAARLLRLVLPAGVLESAVTIVDDQFLSLSQELRWEEGLLGDLVGVFAPSPEDAPLFAADEARDATLFFAREVQGAFQDPADAARVATAFLRRFEEGAPMPRAEAAARVVCSLARFRDARGALALLRAGGPSRVRGFEEASRSIVRLSEGLERDGADLYRGIERLVKDDGSMEQGGP